jgi:hypothetical protein
MKSSKRRNEMTTLAAAEVMGYSSWEDLQKNVLHILSLEEPKVQKLACLLWSLERFGDLAERDDPAALHIDLARHILTVEGASEAIIKAIKGTADEAN